MAKIKATRAQAQAARAELKAARANLAKVSARSREETPDYYVANDRAARAESNVSRWRR